MPSLSSVDPIAKQLPWLQNPWSKMVKLLQRHPHAILINTKPGIGEIEFVHDFVCFLLCLQPQDFACGVCQSCQLFQSGNHPDFMSLFPQQFHNTIRDRLSSRTKYTLHPPPANDGNDEQSVGGMAGREIKVENVRALKELFEKSSHLNPKRIALIYPAETLNAIASNALLKILEEPGNNSYIILMCYQKQRILPTIRSRCISVSVDGPSHEDGVKWLTSQLNCDIEPQRLLSYIRFQNHGVLATLDDFMNVEQNKRDTNNYPTISYKQFSDLVECLEEFPFNTSQKLRATCKELPLHAVLYVLYYWIFDILCIHHQTNPYYFPQSASYTAQLQKSVNIEKIWSFYKNINSLLKVINHPLSTPIQLDSLIQQFYQVFKS